MVLLAAGVVFRVQAAGAGIAGKTSISLAVSLSSLPVTSSSFFQEAAVPRQGIAKSVPRP
jgi:hypothetical protein